MTIEQKDYIEEHIDLIENEDWEEFFKHAPRGIGAVLYDAGIDFMSEMKEVPRSCFTDSDINSVTIPDSVTNISDYAFCRCNSITSITIPNSVRIIGVGAFYQCYSLTSVTIGNSVTSIGDSAFSYCPSLTSITIPSSVTSIEEWAFSGCASLTSIDFNGTKAQWEAIKKGDNWDFPAGNYIIHCTDGDIKK